MYGAEDSIYWYDYDLVIAYPTARANLSLPNYVDISALAVSALAGR